MSVVGPHTIRNEWIWSLSTCEERKRGSESVGGCVHVRARGWVRASECVRVCACVSARGRGEQEIQGTYVRECACMLRACVSV